MYVCIMYIVYVDMLPLHFCRSSMAHLIILICIRKVRLLIVCGVRLFKTVTGPGLALVSPAHRFITSFITNFITVQHTHSDNDDLCRN